MPPACAPRAGVLTSSSGGITGQSFQAEQRSRRAAVAARARSPARAPKARRCSKIVHDLAPGAQLSFANADTDVAFNQAVNFLAASNDVVIDDLGFYGMASDGTSAVSSNTAAALNNGANPDPRLRHRRTATRPTSTTTAPTRTRASDGTSLTGLTTTGHLHLFQRGGDTTDVLGLGPQPYNVISLPTNGEVAIFLTWDDTFGRSANNYDLYPGEAEQRARRGAEHGRRRAGSQDPVEFVDYTNSGANGLLPDRRPERAGPGAGRSI